MFFPAYVNYDFYRDVAAKVDSWTNFYRETDQSALPSADRSWSPTSHWSIRPIRTRDNRRDAASRAATQPQQLLDRQNSDGVVE